METAATNMMEIVPLVVVLVMFASTDFIAIDPFSKYQCRRLLSSSSCSSLKENERTRTRTMVSEWSAPRTLYSQRQYCAILCGSRVL